MIDDPDLHTLAADAIVRVHHGGELLDLDDDDQAAYVDLADAVLAAVLPAHRRQVLAEAEAALRDEDGYRRWAMGQVRVDGRQPLAVVGEGDLFAEYLVERLASAAPETAPSPRHDDETAPAVGREAAQAQGPAEGAAPDRPRTWQLPDDRERAKAAIHQPLHDLNVRIVGLQVGDCHCNLIAEVVLDALTDPERDNPKETP